eukprot:SAG11_NODE_737_length_7431_cov_7.438762_6_plen_58_part_00
MMWEADEDAVGGALTVQDLVDLYFRVATDESGNVRPTKPHSPINPAPVGCGSPQDGS